MEATWGDITGVAVIVAILVLIGLVVVWWWRRQRSPTTTPTPAADPITTLGGREIHIPGLPGDPDGEPDPEPRASILDEIGQVVAVTPEMVANFSELVDEAEDRVASATANLRGAKAIEAASNQVEAAKRVARRRTQDSNRIQNESLSRVGWDEIMDEDQQRAADNLDDAMQRFEDLMADRRD